MNLELRNLYCRLGTRTWKDGKGCNFVWRWNSKTKGTIIIIKILYAWRQTRYEWKKVEEKLQELIQEPDNDNKYQAFVNEYVMLLDQVKINEETVKIAYNAVDFDHGMN